MAERPWQVRQLPAAGREAPLRHAAAGVEAGQACCLAWGPAAGGLQVYGKLAGLGPRGRRLAGRQLVLPRPATGQQLTDLGLGWAGSIIPLFTHKV